jgi:hypothetical protein
VLGEGFTGWFLAFEGRNLRRLLRTDHILGGVGHQILKLQLQLVDEPSRPFGAVAV